MRYEVLKISWFSDAGDGAGGWLKKMIEYSVSLDGIFLTALTDAVSVPGTCLRVRC